MTKRFFSFVMVLVMLIGLVPPMTMNAEPITEETASLSGNEIMEDVAEQALGNDYDAVMSNSEIGAESISGNTVSENDPEEPVRILFVGNSFTDNSKSLPGASVKLQLEALAEQNHKNVYVRRIANDGAHLAYYCDRTDAYLAYYQKLLKELREHEWDYVVIQDYSTNPAYAYDSEMKQSVVSLKKMVYEMQPEAKLLLYMTPGYNYTRKYAGKTQLVPEKDMQRMIGAAYDRLGFELGLEVIPVGMHVSRAKAKYPEIAFNLPNDKHPTVVGYYIAALCFYHRIFGEMPEVDISQMPNSVISQRMAQTLADMTKKSISLDKREVTLETEKTETLYAVDTASGKAAGVTYLSLNPNVATVDKTTGVITAVSAGETSIIAETGIGLQAFCHVMTHQRLSFARADYIVGVQEQIMIKPIGSSQKLTWTSSNRSIAGVDKNGVATTRKPGKTVIIVQNNDIASDRAAYTLYVSCPQPQNLAVSISTKQSRDSKKTRYKLTWTAVTGAEKYKIYRCNTKNGTYTQIGTSSTTQYVDTNVQAGCNRYYKIIATTGSEQCDSIFSASVKAVTRKNPKAKVKRTKRYTTVSWKADASAAGYIVYRSSSKNGTYRQRAIVRKGKGATYKERTNGKTYYYKVIAYSKKGTQPSK